MIPDHEALTKQRVAALIPYGFTGRQAEFLATVMVHGGVCVARQYRVFAGISHGQVVHDFFTKLTSRRWATAYPCSRRDSQIFHVHHKTLYTAIGEPDNRNRRPATIARAIERLMVLDVILSKRDILWLGTEREKLAYCVEQRRLGLADLPSIAFKSARGQTTRYFPDKRPLGVSTVNGDVTFLYVVTEPRPENLRQFVDHHRSLLLRLLPWTFVLAIPRSLAESEGAHRAVLIDLCEAPLRPAVVDEFRWYCQARQALEQGSTSSKPDAVRFARTCRAFRAERFFTVYRRWCRQGDVALHQLLSPALHDAHRQGIARIETTVLPHVYAHLDAIVQTA